MKFRDFYSTAIALKDETLRRIVEKLERARYSAVRIKHSAKNTIVLPSRANLFSRDRTESEENEATLTESSYYDCSSWDFNRSSAKLRYKDDGIHPECFLSMDDCIRRNDYPCDVFTVETEDGFLIEIHRLRNEGKPAVLMQHGILGDSSHWLAAGPDHGLGKRGGVLLNQFISNQNSSVSPVGRRLRCFPCQHAWQPLQSSPYRTLSR